MTLALDEFARLGRLHPLLVHAPIGFLFAALVLELLATRGKLARPSLGLFLWLAALATALAAGAGWILSHEDGYGGVTIERHERLGFALVALAAAAAWLHDPSGRSRRRLGLYRAALVAACVLLVPAGHLGSTLTHGADWLDGPRARPAPALAPEPTESGTRAEPALAPKVVSDVPEDATPTPEPPPDPYAERIAPLLAARCGSCHGPTKQKAHLRLDSRTAMLGGGESGPALVPGDPGASLLFQRARLPLEHEDHMPPEGKPQPSEEELAALAAWIAAGAPAGAEAGSSAGSSSGAPPEDQPTEDKPSDSDAADSAGRGAPPAAALAALERALLHFEELREGEHGSLRIDVAPVAANFGDAEFAALLVPLAPWVVELSLARSRVGDATLAALAVFPALRRLDLRATRIEDAGLAALAGHPALARLELAQTALTDVAVEALASLPRLRTLGLWRAGLSEEALARLRAIPELTVQAGDEPPAEVLEVEGELVFSSDRPQPGAELVPEALRPVNATCPVSGSPVNPEYSLVHAFADGSRVVGFCCSKCPAEFWADPAAFEAKLR